MFHKYNTKALVREFEKIDKPLNELVEIVHQFDINNINFDKIKSIEDRLVDIRAGRVDTQLSDLNELQSVILSQPYEQYKKEAIGIMEDSRNTVDQKKLKLSIMCLFINLHHEIEEIVKNKEVVAHLEKITSLRNELGKWYKGFIKEPKHTFEQRDLSIGHWAGGIDLDKFNQHYNFTKMGFAKAMYYGATGAQIGNTAYASDYEERYKQQVYEPAKEKGGKDVLYKALKIDYVNKHINAFKDAKSLEEVVFLRMREEMNMASMYAVEMQQGKGKGKGKEKEESAIMPIASEKSQKSLEKNQENVSEKSQEITLEKPKEPEKQKLERRASSHVPPRRKRVAVSREQKQVKKANQEKPSLAVSNVTNDSVEKETLLGTSLNSSMGMGIKKNRQKTGSLFDQKHQQLEEKSANRKQSTIEPTAVYRTKSYSQSGDKDKLRKQYRQVKLGLENPENPYTISRVNLQDLKKSLEEQKEAEKKQESNIENTITKISQAKRMVLHKLVTGGVQQLSRILVVSTAFRINIWWCLKPVDMERVRNNFYNFYPLTF